MPIGKVRAFPLLQFTAKSYSSSVDYDRDDVSCLITRQTPRHASDEEYEQQLRSEIKSGNAMTSHDFHEDEEHDGV